MSFDEIVTNLNEIDGSHPDNVCQDKVTAQFLGLKWIFFD